MQAVRNTHRTKKSWWCRKRQRKDTPGDRCVYMCLPAEQRTACFAVRCYSFSTALAPFVAGHMDSTQISQIRKIIALHQIIMMLAVCCCKTSRVPTLHRYCSVKSDACLYICTRLAHSGCHCMKTLARWLCSFVVGWGYCRYLCKCVQAGVTEEASGTIRANFPAVRVWASL